MMKKITVIGSNNGQDESNANPASIYKLPTFPTQKSKASKAAAAPSDVALRAVSGDRQEQYDDAPAEDFTETEWQEVKKRFRDFDLDGNGSIEVEEFVTLCEHIGLARDRAVGLSLLYDEDGDGMIDFREFAKRDIVEDLNEATQKEKATVGKLQESDEDHNTHHNTHVNVAKILQVVRAKMDNSKIAFAFGRYLIFVIIYVYVAFHQRSPQDAVYFNAGLQNYFVGSQYRPPNGQGLYTLMDITTVEGERRSSFSLSLSLSLPSLPPSLMSLSCFPLLWSSQ
jgi:Ca2+-binding EF-hand superfamily protein